MPYKIMVRKEKYPSEYGYLKRISGLSLEVLKKRLQENRIEHCVERQDSSNEYFSDTTLKVRKNPRVIFNDPFIIPPSPLAHFDEEKNIITSCAAYNFLVSLTGNEISLDENILEITKEYAKRLGIYNRGVPTRLPMERVIILEAD